MGRVGGGKRHIRRVAGLVDPAFTRRYPHDAPHQCSTRECAQLCNFGTLDCGSCPECCARGRLGALCTYCRTRLLAIPVAVQAAKRPRCADGSTEHACGGGGGSGGGRDGDDDDDVEIAAAAGAASGSDGGGSPHVVTEAEIQEAAELAEATYAAQDAAQDGATSGRPRSSAFVEWDGDTAVTVGRGGCRDAVMYASAVASAAGIAAFAIDEGAVVVMRHVTLVGGVKHAALAVR